MVGSLGMTAFAEDTSVNEPIDTTVSNYNLTDDLGIMCGNMKKRGCNSS